MSVKISLFDTEFILHCSGAMFWPSRSILLISDVHLGKVSHFRRHGVALPENSVTGNFKKLDKVVDHFGPETIIFLGDLFHNKKNSEWDLFEDWVNRTAARLILVAGNHDVIAQKHYDALDISIYKELIIDHFLLTHHPTEREGLFNFAGHIHPGINLRDLGRQSLKLACFFQHNDQMIVPAFGEFTGKYIMVPKEGDRVWVLTKEDVLRVV